MGKAFEEIQAGLQEAVLHAQGGKTGAVGHEPERVNVKSIRQKTGMTQQQFCVAFGLSLGTLRHWEQGDRHPRGPARVLMKAVEQNPQAVLEAVSS